MSLFSGTGKENRDEGNGISRTDFGNGYALYAFDLSADLSENESFNLARHGTVRIDMTFGAALPHTVTVVAYAEFENIIEIDRNRNVVFDFNNRRIPTRVKMYYMANVENLSKIFTAWIRYQ